MKLISHRVQYDSIDAIIDDYLPQFIKRFNFSIKDAADFRCAMKNIFETFLSQAEWAAALGAEKGIKEALALMNDPKFHETVKKRRAKARAERTKWKEKAQGRELLNRLITDTEQ